MLLENIGLMLICGGVAFVVAFLGKALSSERVRRRGLIGVLRAQFSPTERYRHPYKG